MQSLRIDCHNGGPIVYNSLLGNRMERLINLGFPINKAVRMINLFRKQLLQDGLYPEYWHQINESGLSIMIRTVGIFGDPPFSERCITEDLKLLNEVCELSGLHLIVDLSTMRDCLSMEHHGYIPMVESIEGFRFNHDQLFHLCSTVLPIVQPVYNIGNFFGSGCYDIFDNGLSVVGQSMLRAFSTFGTIIDHSHISEKTAMDIIESGFDHNIATHTCSYSLTRNKRGKSDSFFRAMGEVDGFVAITVNPNLIAVEGLSIRDSFLINVEHILNLVGEDKVGIGTDWDGPMPSCMVTGLKEESRNLGNNNYSLDLQSNLYNQMSDWNNLFYVLSERFGGKMAQKIAGINALKYFNSHLRKL